MYSFGLRTKKDSILTRRNVPGPGSYDTRSFLSDVHGSGTFGKIIYIIKTNYSRLYSLFIFAKYHFYEALDA